MSTKTNTLTDEQFNAEFDSSLLVKSTSVPADVAKLETTSAKIRALSGLGWTRGAIAKALDIRYQHVRNVLITPLKRK